MLRAKSEVIRHIRRGGLLIINSDDEKLDLLWQIHEGYETEDTGLPEDIRNAIDKLKNSAE